MATHSTSQAGSTKLKQYLEGRDKKDSRIERKRYRINLLISLLAIGIAIAAVIVALGDKQ